MIRLTGAAVDAGLMVESDRWMPLKCTWNVALRDMPQYIRVSGEMGGELELKVDSDTLFLYQLIVLEWAPRLDVDRAFSWEFASGETDSVPQFDTSTWSQHSDGSLLRMARTRVSMSTSVVDRRIALRLDSIMPHAYIGRGLARFGVSQQRELVEICFPTEAVSRFQLPNIE